MDENHLNLPIAPDNCPRCKVPLYQWGQKSANIFICANQPCCRFEFCGKDPIRLIRVTLNDWLFLIFPTKMEISNNKLDFFSKYFQGNFFHLIFKSDEKLINLINSIMIFQ